MAISFVGCTIKLDSQIIRDEKHKL